MKLLSKTPDNPELKKDISHIYYLHCENEEMEYSIYPINANVLMFYQNADRQLDTTKISIKGNNKNDFKKIMVGPFNKPKIVKYSGNIKMIGIVFKNHAIYNFDDFNEYFLNEKQLHSSADSSDLILFKNTMLSKKTPEEMLLEMEKYFLENKKPIHHKVLDECMDLIGEENNWTLSQLSKEIKVSKKTIIKHFNKYLGRTPSNFLAVEKLRSSLKTKSINLTGLAYELGYYDQSHMVKSIKKITGETPSKIRAKKNISGYNSLQWLQ